MELVKFRAAFTNIFPLVNSKVGGQLLTEFNIRSREGVMTDPNVKYWIGPSFTHSEEDFYVGLPTTESQYYDANGQLQSFTGTVGSAILEISPGRALVNGHFVESFAPIYIDLAEENYIYHTQYGGQQLKGDLAIGLKILYSDDITMMGSMLTENSEYYFEGIKVVILPRDQFITPSDAPSNPELVTAHLKLASFNYSNGAIKRIAQNPSRSSYIPASRICDIDGVMASSFLKKSDLDKERLYALAGYGYDNGEADWCDITYSMVNWGGFGSAETVSTNPDTSLRKPEFRDSEDGFRFILPRKQLDHPGVDAVTHRPRYFPPVDIPVPDADYETGRRGVVSPAIIQKIKDLNTTLNNFYQLPQGKLRKFIERLSSADDLPAISKFWGVGDYILVLEDETVKYDSTVSGPPSTMYVVIPGLVKSIKLNTSVQGGADGMESSEITGQSFQGNFFPGTQIDFISKGIPMQAPPSASEIAREYYANFQDTSLRGEVNKDYITLAGLNTSNQDVTYFYVVKAAGPCEYSGPIRITAPVPFATDSLVGGFLNVPGDAYGNGYVRMDSAGHLYLVDKDLYNSGTLAYTLTEDVVMPSGLTAEEIQNTLTEYVNSRIAMPFVADSSAAIDFAERNSSRSSSRSRLSDDESSAGVTITRPKDPNCVNVTITLSPWSGDNEIHIRELDSRFNTYVYLHITGSVHPGTRIYIADCEKIRLDISTIDASSGERALPIIAVYRSNIYYDADVMNDIAYMENIRLWYNRYESDALNLVVDGMTVICQDATIEPTNIQSYDPVYGLDTHYRYALHDVTFDTNGYIIGFGLLVGNESTAGDEEGSTITTAEFEIPQSNYFKYPENRLNKSMKVSGSFVAAYEFSGEDSGYVVKDTKFSASTKARVPGSMQNTATGVIAFLTKVEKIYGVNGLTVSPDAILDCWDSKGYHLFQGGIIA